MRLIPRFRSKALVGLDIGSSSVKAVELEAGPKGFELVRIGLAPVPPEAIVQGAFLNSGAIAAAVRAALESGGIATRDVSVSVSGHSVIVKKIVLPSMTREELEESIRWEAEQYIPFDVNEVNLDFQIVSQAEAEGQMDVLLVAAKRELVDDYVQVLGEAGLRPRIVDVAGFAIANAFEASCEVPPDDVVALVNIGAQVVNINIVSGGVPAFTRDVSAGGNQYTEEIQKALSIGFEEAERMKLGGSLGEDSQEVVPQEVEDAMRSVTEGLVAEIMRTLDFFVATAPDRQISQIVLCGGAARVPGIDKAFHEKTQLPVSILDPLARVQPGRRLDAAQLEEIAPALGVAVGLALRRSEES